MTLTATRATGTVRPTSSPTLRFLGGVGMMVLQFFGGLVAVPLATILGALVGQLIEFVINLIWFGLSGVGDEGLSLGASAGLILVLAGLAWFSFRHRAWMLLWGGITAAALQWAFVVHVMHEFMKAPI